MTGCQRGDLISADLEVWIGADEKGVSSPLDECCEGCVDVVFSTSIQDMEQQPERRRAAACTFLYVGLRTSALIGFARKPTDSALGTISLQQFEPLAVNTLTQNLTPVTLPPGRFRLATRPSLTGIAASHENDRDRRVAALAASAEGVPPVVTMHSDRARTRSADQPADDRIGPRPNGIRSHVSTFNIAGLFADPAKGSLEIVAWLRAAALRYPIPASPAAARAPRAATPPPRRRAA